MNIILVNKTSHPRLDSGAAGAAGEGHRKECGIYRDKLGFTLTTRRLDSPSSGDAAEIHHRAASDEG
jgi:hypothetical protein